MHQNKFKIVIPSYNNLNWVEPNIASILNQTYDNYDVLYIDDASTDGTYEAVRGIVKDLPNWTVVRNEVNRRRGYNLNPHNKLISDFIGDSEDIVMFVDGDDWLYDEFVLKNLNELYNEKNYWMTYGTFVCYPSGDVGYPQNTEYPKEVHGTNRYRGDTWRASHLRTFKWHLYSKIREEDLIFSQTGEYYYHAEDLATSFPCLEMCPQDKIGVVPFYTYVYNVSQEARDRVENDLTREPRGYKTELAVRESEIRSKAPYNCLIEDKLITCQMAGGLGNMMFQVAASYATGLDQGHTPVLNSNHVGTFHRAVQDYKDSIFSKISIAEGSKMFTRVQEQDYTYSTIPFVDSNILLDGYFQSYKYFHHHRKDIQDLYAPTPEVLKRLPGVDNISVKVSLHVRRGDYLKYSQHHHNLSLSYYRNAIDYFKGYKFVVFSDDIEWCKDNFKGDQFTFVEGTDDIQDLYLMSMCKHHIIANSTFSWWGAYLNKSEDKIVVYPDKWFGSLNSHMKTWDLFPEEWVCLSETTPVVTINLFDNSFGHLTKPNGRYSSVHGKVSSKVKYVRNESDYKGITLFTDEYLVPNNILSEHKVGWLLETREVNPSKYDNFEQYKDSFDFILTHDKELLDKYPDRTKFTVFGGTWINTKNYGIHPKTKEVSMVYSDKQYLTGHKLRHQVASTVKDIDLYGRGTVRPIAYKEEALIDYRYSIVIENSKTDNYFTEKLIDCLLVGTVPIYWGCTNLDAFFDTRGIIQVSSLEEIAEVVANLNESNYISRMEYIQNNFSIAQDYAITEDWMYENVFKELLR